MAAGNQQYRQLTPLSNDLSVRAKAFLRRHAHFKQAERGKKGTGEFCHEHEREEVRYQPHHQRQDL